MAKLFDLFELKRNKKILDEVEKRFLSNRRGFYRKIYGKFPLYGLFRFENIVCPGLLQLQW